MILPHTATVVTPAAAADAYGTPNAALDYGAGAARRDVAAFLQPRDSSTFFDGTLRAAARTDWVMFTTDRQVTTPDRVEWEGHVFDVTGVSPWDRPGGFHHAEVNLREVLG